MCAWDVNVFIPEFWNFGERTRIEGYVTKTSNNVLGLYIYGNNPKKKRQNELKNCCSEWEHLNTAGVLDGYIYKSNELPPESPQSLNYVFLESENGRVKLKQLKCNGQILDCTTTIRSCVVMFYDYASILKSEDFFSHEPEQSLTMDRDHVNQFDVLNNIVKHDNSVCPERLKINYDDSLNYLKKFRAFHFMLNVYKPLCAYSNLCVQLCSWTNSINWILHCIWKERKISVKTGNLITSMLIDLLGGLIILHCINQWTLNPVNELYDLIQLIVDNLRTLLKWLMGSPAGLKLNHAFNNMLGKFFLYHIELWWMFLVITKNILEMVLQVFQYLGMLGISFQTAILADILSLASFHIYCIYTYAARLYNIQISGLIALWRLFLGRKHNPLRGGVDSCEYNHHQLFVGTLAFTILLFLLPTTALYYIVFTAFRLILVLLGGLLTWIRYIIQSLPLYLIVLWLTKSRRIAGEIKISLISSSETTNKPIMLRVHLQTASILHLIKSYSPPPFSKPVAIQWGEIISSLCRGKLLYPVLSGSVLFSKTCKFIEYILYLCI